MGGASEPYFFVVPLRSQFKSNFPSDLAVNLSIHRLMGSAHQMENLLDGVGGNGEAELNYGTRNEHKEIRDGRAGNGEGLYEEDEFRINEAALDTKDSHVQEAASVAHNPVLEKQQHKFLAPVVQWERFLPLRTIKVLLVENDDSTRQVVSALLRNCYNGVTAVANVLEAWRVLEDLTNHIDLVLTEHIWIRCHNSSGSRSGSESGIQGQNITQSDNDDVSDNNTYSDDEDNVSIGCNARDESDYGSGTQQGAARPSPSLPAMENLLDGVGGNGEAELNYGTRNEHKEIRDGRAGNGLYDTVFDVDGDKERAQSLGLEPNGFSFEGTNSSGVDYALNRYVFALEELGDAASGSGRNTKACEASGMQKKYEAHHHRRGISGAGRSLRLDCVNAGNNSSLRIVES
ncbi:Two-component response regulator-like APRR3 [Platanthera guangdongensis]|uniref:Two-component response regulator-like APRR3 n=1 Tax=Platanthera guangdongensis TaxID=2320717 RepID=A0ABR2MT74_9ASPA